MINPKISLTERVIKVIKQKIERDGSISTPGIMVSVHAIKIGCCEVGGEWISINIENTENLNPEYHHIGTIKGIPIYFDSDSLYLLRDFSTLTFDIKPSSSNTLVIKELTY
ncbi:MAG: hypothetical protein ACTSYB_03565 [Candidatus Helarchaeota archaeon]